MPRKNDKHVYKSFEQFKADVFPNLSKQEGKKGQKKDMKGLGATMADRAIDELLVA